ncbi:MAG: response regulator [Candidatus Methanoperedens sp.]|nr:response regulator [Candidatus Methanoperedens sp.]
MKAKILVVDDEPINVRLITEILTADYEIIEASGGKEAIEKMISEKPDIVLLDIMMPEINGYEVCKKIKQNELTRFTPVVMVTALSESEDKVLAIEAGADDFLTKPINFIELITRVKSLLRGKHFYDQLLESRERIAQQNEALQKARDELEVRVRERTAELTKANEALECSNEFSKTANIKLKKADEIKTQFLSVVSHELRTPLTPIKAQLQMILAGYFGELTEKQKKSLDMIMRNTLRQDRLVGDILDISKLEAGEMKFMMTRSNLNEVIVNAVETMIPLANPKNVILTLKQDIIPEILLDKDRITQVIVNLINNALKFTDSGGTIDVELSGAKDCAIIKVKDTGIGIKKEDQERLFRPFVQVDSSYGRKYEGSGLGLAISKGIITFHGGKIWIESEEGKGSTFQFTIPYIYENKDEKVKVNFF